MALLPSSDDDVLPIDAYAPEIVAAIRTHRVTIIHGETGCGKSSRLPSILDSDAKLRREPAVRMMISQPRRIAARMLAERLRSSHQLAGAVGYRMGHGARDEQRSTRIWYVTSGYLARLLAHHPSAFDSHSHLVIDEVHERSIDTDILCLLARRLLRSHKHIRLVLMSATIAANQFRDYFTIDGDVPPVLFVGVRRFPVSITYASDKAELRALLPKAVHGTADRLAQDTERGMPPNLGVTRSQHDLAAALAVELGKAGSSVLVFVSGMADIEALAEKLELVNARPLPSRHWNRYLPIPVHSDVPHDEQLAMLAGARLEDAEPLQEGESEVRVILATNAAESSVTLPDVDVVVCLGAAKQVAYNAATHRQKLELSWISQASATQRAGRTGRLRPGRVIRLYHRALHDKRFPPFDSAEVTRMPLDAVIVSLRTMFGDGPVTAVLNELLEPPDTRQIARSFTSLHAAKLLDAPDDSGMLTGIGAFVAALGADLAVGRLVALGAQLGILPEAVALGAALSLPNAPFAQASPLVHGAAQYNELVRASMLAQDALDRGDYCEPLAALRLLHAWKACRNPAQQRALVARTAASWVRLRALEGLHTSIAARVAEKLGLLPSQVADLDDPARMAAGKVLAIRLLVTWVFHDQLIAAHPLPSARLRALEDAADAEALRADAGVGGGGDAGGGNAGGGAAAEPAGGRGTGPRTRGGGGGGRTHGGGRGSSGGVGGEGGAGIWQLLPLGIAVTGRHIDRAALAALLPPRCRFALSGGQVREYVAPARRPPVLAAHSEAVVRGAADLLADRLWRLARAKGAECLLLVCLLDPTTGLAPSLELRLGSHGELACAPTLQDALGAGAATAPSARCADYSQYFASAPTADGQRLAVARAYKRLRAVVQAQRALTCLLNDEGVLLVATGGVQAEEDELCAAVGGEGFAVQPATTMPGQPQPAPVFKARVHALKQRITFAPEPPSPPRPHALIADLPLSVRILGQLAVGHRNKAVIRLPPPAQPHHLAAAGHHAPPRANGAAGRRPAAFANGGGGGDEDESAADWLRVDVPTPSWRVLDSDGGLRGGPAFVPYHSLAAAAVHVLGSEPVFAVAATMLDLQGAGARCSSITLLPPGRAWIAKALLAFGLRADHLEHDLSAEEAEEAAQIDARYRSLGDNLSADDELAAALQRLFDVPLHEQYVPAAHGAEHVLVQADPEAAARVRARRERMRARAAGAGGGARADCALEAE